MLNSETANYRNFTKKRPEVYFDLNDERFHCRKALNPKKLQAAMRSFRSIQQEFKSITATSGTEDELTEASNLLLDKIAGTLKHFVKEESYLRLELMLNEEDPDEPVDITQLMEILQWLLESLTGRPTTPSSDSTSTSQSDDGGTSLTAGVQLDPSTLSNLLHQDSLI